jgi:bacillithiol system protein YtxJ
MLKNCTTIQEWQDILQKSYTETVIVYKHSNTCPISTGALMTIEQGITEGQIIIPIYIVVVQQNRDISDAIATDMGVEHESPQIILIKDGQVLYTASHYDIAVADMVEYLA